MVKRCFLAIAFLMTSLLVIAQDGFNPYAGLVFSSNRDAAATTNGDAQMGFLIGIDARITKDQPQFIIGGQYIQMSLLGAGDSFFGHEQSLKILKGRIGAGMTIKEFSRDMRLRGRVLGSLDYTYLYQSDVISGRASHRRINDAVIGVLGGLGLDYGKITFDLEYEAGLINYYYKEPNSKQDYFTFHVGYLF